MSEESMAAVRAEFADILIEHTRTRIEDCHCGWGVDTGALGQSHSLHVAEALLPVVTRHVEQARADELHEIERRLKADGHLVASLRVHYYIARGGDTP